MSMRGSMLWNTQSRVVYVGQSLGLSYGKKRLSDDFNVVGHYSKCLVQQQRKHAYQDLV